MQSRSLLDLNTEETKVGWECWEGRVGFRQGKYWRHLLDFGGGRGRSKRETERGTKLQQRIGFIESRLD